jgi:hypothetical protein
MKLAYTGDGVGTHSAALTDQAHCVAYLAGLLPARYLAVARLHKGVIGAVQQRATIGCQQRAQGRPTAARAVQSAMGVSGMSHGAGAWETLRHVVLVRC